jgi:hypothetical protein
MNADLCSNYGLKATLSPYNRNFAKRVRNCFYLSFSCFVFVMTYFLLSYAWTQSRSPAILPFVPCSLELTPTRLLIEAMNKSGKITCSTQFQSVPQPCLCCVFGDCWRDAKIVYNSSFSITVTDKENGIIRKRKIPKAMTVHYNFLDNNRIVTEEGTKVSFVLRAIELLKGWSPAGDPEDLDL